MRIEIERFPSGFYGVRVNGKIFNAALGSHDQAKEFVKQVIAAENKKQNNNNEFINIDYPENALLVNGLYIEFDFYGDSAYTVQFCGDDLYFCDLQSAIDFCESMN